MVTTDLQRYLGRAWDAILDSVNIFTPRRQFHGHKCAASHTLDIHCVGARNGHTQPVLIASSIPSVGVCTSRRGSGSGCGGRRSGTLAGEASECRFYIHIARTRSPGRRLTAVSSGIVVTSKRCAGNLLVFDIESLFTTGSSDKLTNRFSEAG